MIKPRKVEPGRFAELLYLPKEDGTYRTVPETAEELGISQPQGYVLKRQFEEGTLSEVEKFKKQVYKRAMEPKSTAKHMELYAKMNNLVVEKSEVTVIELTADEIARTEQEAKRRSREFRESLEKGGVEDVSGRLPLLSESLRKN